MVSVRAKDTGIKEIVVKKQEFPALVKLAENVYGHFFRYRIVSEDKNRFSHWSKMTPLEVFTATNLPAQVEGTLNISGSSIAIVWDDEIDRPRYDIFVSFNGGAFLYHGTSPIHSYSIVSPQSFSSISVAIQIESVDKERSNILTICELNDTI